MVTSFRALLLAGVFSLAVCDWCDEHAALQIWDQDSNPGMIPQGWYEPGATVSAFTQDPDGYRYFLGRASGGLASVVMSSPEDGYGSHSLVVALGEHHDSCGLAVSSDGLRLFIVSGPYYADLQECPTTPESQLGKCTTIVNGLQGEYFQGVVYDDANHVLYATRPGQNIIVAFSQDPNGIWESERLVAGNADEREHVDLTGLNIPSALSLYERDLFILDANNMRIVRWAPEALTAKTEYKAEANIGLFALGIGEGKIYYMDTDARAVYSLDAANPNAPKQRVAGGCGRGKASNQLSGLLWTSIFVDAEAGTIVIWDHNRVVEWSAGG